MNFKYFKDINDKIFAFDIDDETQLPYMQIKIDEGCEDITDTWVPPQPVIAEQPKPTIESLQAQLISIQEQINLLTNG
jgi:hypothetical protein